MSKRPSLLLLACLWPATVAAQPASTVVSTLRSTDTTTNSIRVGCTNAGPCTGGVTAGPIDVSQVTSAGAISIGNNVPAATTFKLYNNAGTLMWNGTTVAVGGSVSGTTNTIAVFTAASALGNSIMTQSGTTITVANTLNATTLGGTLSTTAQNSVTTMTALATVGTITAGTWQGTKIGLGFGGTNADLSGTGGTSQFLRQNTLGGTVTVVRPAVNDLSDAANLALLNAVNVFTALGTHTWSAGGAGQNVLAVRNTAAGVANYSGLFLGNDTDPTNFFIQSFSSTYTSLDPRFANGALIGAFNAGGLSIGSFAGTGALRLYAGSALRWGINSAGDVTVGASSHIQASTGTPTITSGAGAGASISGNYTAFGIVAGTGAGASIIVAFGHTWTAAPVCVSNAGDRSVTSASNAINSSVTIATSGTVAAGVLLTVLCHGS